MGNGWGAKKLMSAITPVDLTQLLREAPAGDWLALSCDQQRIVGNGKTVDEAIRMARESGEDSPIVMKAPPMHALIL